MNFFILPHPFSTFYQTELSRGAIVMAWDCKHFTKKKSNPLSVTFWPKLQRVECEVNHIQTWHFVSCLENITFIVLETVSLTNATRCGACWPFPISPAENKLVTNRLVFWDCVLEFNTRVFSLEQELKRNVQKMHSDNAEFKRLTRKSDGLAYTSKLKFLNCQLDS